MGDQRATGGQRATARASAATRSRARRARRAPRSPLSSPALLAAPAGAVWPPPPPPPPVKVIVQQLSPNDPAPAALGRAWPAARSPSSCRSSPASRRRSRRRSLDDLVDLPGVRAVTGDHDVVPVERRRPRCPSGPSVHREAIGSSAANADGLTGAGTTVAVIDTGIADVAPLARRPVVGPDEQRHAAVPQPLDESGCADSFGHGTFVAGMVNSVAPDADLALRQALRSRRQVAASATCSPALQWVIANRTAYGIDVVNLSLRSDSSLSYRIDPLNLAVEQVWANGITVVVAAGNQGGGAGTIAKPGDDPWVITVGASDDHGTASTADDTVADFSSRGPTLADGLAKPDVVAPGKSLHSLRSPGSEADLRYPNFVDDDHRLGSGTSFAAPEVAGAAALLLQADPTRQQRPHQVRPHADGAARSAPPTPPGTAPSTCWPRSSAPAGEANQDNWHPILFPTGIPWLLDLLGTEFEGTSWQGTSAGRGPRGRARPGRGRAGRGPRGRATSLAGHLVAGHLLAGDLVAGDELAGHVAGRGPRGKGRAGNSQLGWRPPHAG